MAMEKTLMWHALLEYALFLAKVLTFLAALLLALLMLAALRRQRSPEGRLELRHVNERYAEQRQQMQSLLLSGKDFKRWQRAQRRQDKEDEGRDKARVFVLSFDGDLRASALAHLRQEISALLAVAEPGRDEVALCLESPGGMVHAYGLAASQLHRLRQAGLRLTVCVDKVAASGGYMMAAVADHIVAAPFAVIGSIGVVAQLPNLHRFLQKHDVDIELHTAGAFKRTLTVLGENTEAGRNKFKEDLEQTHVLFKDFVVQHRPVVDIEQVATGEHWFATQALALKLIDELATSDSYLIALCAEREVYEVHYRLPRPWLDRLGTQVAQVLTRIVDDLSSVRLIP